MPKCICSGAHGSTPGSSCTRARVCVCVYVYLCVLCEPKSRKYYSIKKNAVQRYKVLIGSERFPGFRQLYGWFEENGENREKMIPILSVKGIVGVGLSTLNSFCG